MKQEVLKYFMDLHQLQEENGEYINLDTTPKQFVKNAEGNMYSMKKYKINNYIFYTKPWYLIDSLFSLASS